MLGRDEQTEDRSSAQRRVDEHPFWYHTIDVVPGVTTRGQFDLRPIVDQFPWPDVQGKRCLDVGTFDGFLAFELERRGASEVVAVDIEDHNLWDWPPDYRSQVPKSVADAGWPPKGAGFRLIAEIKGSKVDWRPISVYDLNVEEIGTFDIVICGSLLLHLRDPLRALEAIRGVTHGYFLSSEQIELSLTLLGRQRPLLTLNGSGGLCQWFNFNAAGHERLLYASGFEILKRSRPYVERFNEHPLPPRTLRERARTAGFRVLTGTSNSGVLHQALLSKPRVEVPGTGS
jgi:tRNA (mo5U34)-methyltransferase